MKQETKTKIADSLVITGKVLLGLFIAVAGVFLIWLCYHVPACIPGAAFLISMVAIRPLVYWVEDNRTKKR